MNSPLTSFDCPRNLLQTGHMSDITFYVGESKTNSTRFLAHKCFVSYASPVFSAMFEDKFVENETGEILITDVTTLAFNALLRFIYTNEFNEKITTLEYADILYAAKKYLMEPMTNCCLQKLAKRAVNFENFWSYFNIVNYYFSEQMPPIMVIKTLRFLSDNSEELLCCDECVNLSFDIVGKIIDSKSVKVDSELTVINFILNWSRMECYRQKLDVTFDNRRKVLGDIIYKIRFLTLTSFDLKNQSELLSKTERYDVLIPTLKRDDDEDNYENNDDNDDDDNYDNNDDSDDENNDEDEDNDENNGDDDDEDNDGNNGDDEDEDNDENNGDDEDEDNDGNNGDDEDEDNDENNGDNEDDDNDENNDLLLPWNKYLLVEKHDGYFSKGFQWTGKLSIQADPPRKNYKLLIISAKDFILDKLCLTASTHSDKFRINGQISKLNGEILKHIKHNFERCNCDPDILVDISICLKAYTCYILDMEFKSGTLSKNKYNLHYCSSNGGTLLIIQECSNCDQYESKSPEYWQSLFKSKENVKKLNCFIKKVRVVYF